MDDRLDVVCVHGNNVVDGNATSLHASASRSLSLKSDDSGCVRDDALCRDVHQSRLNGDDVSENAAATSELIYEKDTRKTHKLLLREDDRCDKTDGNSLPRLPRSKHCDSHRTTGRGQFPGRCMKFIQSTPTLESCDETRQMPEVHEQLRCIRESNTSSNAGGEDDDLRGRTNGTDLAKQNMSLNIPSVVEESPESAESSNDGRTSPVVEGVVRVLPRQHRHSGRNISSKQSWLLRLFESKMFDMSIAITYLFNSKEPGVQSYLGESRLEISIVGRWRTFAIVCKCD